MLGSLISVKCSSGQETTTTKYRLFRYVKEGWVDFVIVNRFGRR